MRTRQVGGASGGYGDRAMLSVRNSETVSITRGRPVILVLNGTNDGTDVVLPSTAGANKSNALCYGVSQETIAAGVISDVLSMGYCPYLLISRATRAASSDSWTSSASLAAYEVLTIDTINNCWATAAATEATNINGDALMVDSVASMAASATATSDTRTAFTSAVRAFVRFM